MRTFGNRCIRDAVADCKDEKEKVKGLWSLNKKTSMKTALLAGTVYQRHRRPSFVEDVYQSLPAADEHIAMSLSNT